MKTLVTICNLENMNLLVKQIELQEKNEFDAGIVIKLNIHNYYLHCICIEKFAQIH